MEEDIIYCKLKLKPPLLSCPYPQESNANVSSSVQELHLGPMAKNNHLHMIQEEEYPEPDHVSSDGSEIKTQIATHPLYPNLLYAFIQCQKVGAPTKVASLLEEIGRESHNPIRPLCQIGDDPDLDDFMESYCQVLHRYKEELSKPFNEATVFLCDIESQLSDLCKGTLTISSHHNNRSGGTSGDELSCGKQEVDEAGCGSSSNSMCPAGDNKELKEMLLRKYGGYLGSLKNEFLKKRKKGKLPKDARKTLMDWWTLHYRWPYPTEEEKLQLSEMSGLDIKQINNWFINQRKRHWKPSGDMRFAIIEGVTNNDIAGGGPP